MTDSDTERKLRRDIEIKDELLSKRDAECHEWKDKVAHRTVRAHLRKLVSLGVLDVAEVYPGHRYRLAEKASKRNAGNVQRLQSVASVFGL